MGCTQYVFLLSNVLTSCPHICTTGHLIGVAYRSSVDYCCCGHTHPTHYPTIIQKGILKNHFIINEIFWARPKECLEFTLPLTIWGDNWFICLMLLLLFMCRILWKNISNPECYHNNDAGPALLVSTLLLKLLLLRQLQPSMSTSNCIFLKRLQRLIYLFPSLHSAGVGLKCALEPTTLVCLVNRSMSTIVYHFCHSQNWQNKSNNISDESPENIKFEETITCSKRLRKNIQAIYSQE